MVLLADAVRRMLRVSADTDIALVPLAGGVSSDIYRADVAGRTLCVKRALPKLKVAAVWEAPVERNRYEVEWLRVAGEIVPDAVPALLGEDEPAKAFAMAYLPPERYPVWKALLRNGTIDTGTAHAVGALLGRLHARTADQPPIAARFASDGIFHAIRLEPYLIASGRAHPDLASRLNELVAVTSNTRRVLVHGDFSPKNLLIGPDGPIIVDAECACFGDPAFDLGFVLNHLLLKGAWKPQWRARYLAAFDALIAAYRRWVAWEPWLDLEQRTAALLPGLLLARIDGKSPVEYLVEPAVRDAVRRFARALIADPVPSLAPIGGRWRDLPPTGAR